MSTPGLRHWYRHTKGAITGGVLVAAGMIALLVLQLVVKRGNGLLLSLPFLLIAAGVLVLAVCHREERLFRRTMRRAGDGHPPTAGPP